MSFPNANSDRESVEFPLQPLRDDLVNSFPEQDEASWVDAPLPNTRNGARQLALQVLYWEASLPGDFETALANLGPRRAIAGPNLEFAKALVHLTTTHRNELDKTIGAAVTNWSHKRLARVDALILRLALAEISYFEDIPVRVSLDQAVELARTYGADQSYAFVNGVLDAIVRQQDQT